MATAELIENNINIEFIAQELFKKVIADIPADRLTPEEALKIYTDIYKRMWVESGKMIRESSMDNVESKYNFR